MASVELNNMSFSYGGHQVFAGMDLQLQTGNIYGLLGLNGAGKSTLLNLVSGLLFADAGGINTLGYRPAERTPEFLADIFVLPEDLNVPTVKAADYALAYSQFYPRFDYVRFERYLEEFQLPRNKRLTEYSHGQKKKFFLSFGLACQSSLLILDEPSNGLDIPSKALFRRLVAEAATEDRLFVISTHQLRDVESLIDPIVILHEGKVGLNASMDTLCQKIHMHRSDLGSSIDGQVLYTEPTLGGQVSIMLGEDPEGLLDLELLFNFAIARPDAVRELGLV